MYVCEVPCVPCVPCARSEYVRVCGLFAFVELYNVTLAH
jgi:hypothetical protein